MNEYRFEEIEIGTTENFTVEITEQMMHSFSMLTGDINPLHKDRQYAREKGYKDKVCYGMLTASWLSTLAGVYLPGKNSLIHSMNVHFVKPVIVGDTLTVRGTVTEINDTFEFIVLKVEIYNQDGVKVLRGKMEVSVQNG